MRMSQLMLSSQPPPRAKPFTAAMVGMGMVSSLRNTLLPFLPKASPPALVRVLISPMSAPATKAFSPDPVSTSARISSSAFTSSTNSFRSSRTSEFRALSALGRLMVATAMLPFFSNRTLVTIAPPSILRRIVSPRSSADWFDGAGLPAFLPARRPFHTAFIIVPRLFFIKCFPTIFFVFYISHKT